MSEQKLQKILELVDKNSNVIPEGDYLEICNLLRDIRREDNRRPDEEVMRHELLLMNRDLLNALYRQNSMMTSESIRNQTERATRDINALITLYRSGNVQEFRRE